MKRPCLEPQCGSLASPTGRGRCELHAKERDKQVKRLGKKVYSTRRWAILRRRKLVLNSICEWEGCREIATDVHHRHGVIADPWSLDGLESLCHAHHSRLTRSNQLKETA